MESKIRIRLINQIYFWFHLYQALSFELQAKDAIVIDLDLKENKLKKNLILLIVHREKLEFHFHISLCFEYDENERCSGALR